MFSSCNVNVIRWPKWIEKANECCTLKNPSYVSALSTVEMESIRENISRTYIHKKKGFLRNICERLKNTTLLFGNILINAIVIFRISPSKMMAPRWLNCNRLKTLSCTGMKISRCGKKGLLRMYLNPSCNMRNNWIGNKNTEPRGNNSAWTF